MKRSLVLSLAAAVAIAVAIGVASATAGNAASVAVVHPECVKKADKARSVSYSSSDGARLAGVSFGSGKVGIVFAPGHSLDLCTWMPAAREIARKGYRVLLFDFAGSFGASRPSATKPVDLAAELGASVARLKALGAKQVVLIGNEAGAHASHLAAASMNPAPLAIVDMSSPVVFEGESVLPSLSRSKAPILYVAAKKPGHFGQSAAVGRRILAAATQAKAKKLVVAANPSDLNPPEYFRYAWGKPVKQAVLSWIAKYGKVSGGAGSGKTTRAPYIPADATVPKELVGDWQRSLDFSCDGSNDGDGVFRLKPDGSFDDRVPNDLGYTAYPGIWYMQGDTFYLHYYYAGPSEGSPKGSLLTAKVTDLNTKSMSGTFTSPLGSGFGCWQASR
jgi:pimeloyl-ACP methyl ester carboxylesterase